MDNLMKDSMTIMDAKKYLMLFGINWTETWLRIQISQGKIDSFKFKHMRLISRQELNRIIKKKEKNK